MRDSGYDVGDGLLPRKTVFGGGCYGHGVVAQRGGVQRRACGVTLLIDASSDVGSAASLSAGKNFVDPPAKGVDVATSRGYDRDRGRRGNGVGHGRRACEAVLACGGDRESV